MYVHTQEAAANEAWLKDRKPLFPLDPPAEEQGTKAKVGRRNTTTKKGRRQRQKAVKSVKASKPRSAVKGGSAAADEVPAGEEPAAAVS